MSQFFARKPLQMLMDEMAGEHRLRRVLGPIQLTFLGIGCIIGTGIFVLTGVAAHDKAGPALMLSFAVAGMACIFAALCYAEFASMIPVAGSAYTYAYATLGELLAWIIGWDLILEYGVASAAVANGWSHYFQQFIGMFGLHLPSFLTVAPFDFSPETGLPQMTRSLIDFPAMFIVVAMTILLVIGIRESAGFNAIMVVIKLTVVLLVIVVGWSFVKPENWQPFAPYGYGGLSFFGTTVWGDVSRGGEPMGMMAGAATIFFAYIGFDAVSTQAEEARNPRRDVPIGIIASLIVCTVLYIGVAAVLTGMVRYDQIEINAPVAAAFKHVGLRWAEFVISLGALAGITSVLLVLMLSQPRVLLAMARDRLLPPAFFATVHPRFQTPWKSSIVTGIFVGLMAAVLPLRILAELVNIGTLLAFTIVCAAVLIMRRTQPNAERPFRVPFAPVIPLLGMIMCLLLMFSLPWQNWVRLGVWLAVGFVIYFGYGRYRSVFAPNLERFIGTQGVSGSGFPVAEIEQATEDPAPGNPDRPQPPRA
ncbi:MAG TPA: amino acid permease [Phycisphaerae bacterium]|nr:amino acid permease [Phycisphaerae bacterium]HRY68790.1 amino acid permease [Phycisphaerae bacterium]HSA27453.1 amino acid permease [Phycisphaerae bacterium]